MKNWPQILGHERVLDVLSRAVDTGRLHHAYLFTGPSGVGKFTVAKAMAAALNCERRGDEFTPGCGECSTCRRIENRQHPDVLFVEPPKKVIKIEQIREIQRASISAPYEGRVRCVLINDAHTMPAEAANALLKTLEEPPDRMLLFVITDQPHRLLDTIISRCQRMRFGTLDESAVVDALPEYLDEEVEPDLLEIAAGYGEGSLGRSVSILNSGMLAERREFLSNIFEIDPRSTCAWLDLADELSDSTADLEHRIDVLTVFFRDVMLFKRAEASRVVNADLMDLVKKVAPRFSLEAILTTLDALMSARRRMQFHVNATLLTEDLLDRMRDPDSRALLPPA